jgi:dolichol kinase
VNSSAIQTAPIARPSRVPQLRPIVRELAPATSPEIAAPSSSRRWWWLTDRVAGFFNERLGAQETKRRLLHATPGLLPFLLWSVPHDDPSSLRFQLVIGGLIVVLAAVAYYQFGRVQRTAERPKDVMRAVFGYATVVLVTMVLGSRHVEVAFAALAILAFGDGSATLGGKLMRGGRLPWNSKKTIAGTFCFILVATPMAALIYWCQAHDVYAVSNFPRVNVEQALLGAFAAAVAAALVESLPMRTNDNLRVGVTAAAVIVLFQWLVVGWV